MTAPMIEGACPSCGMNVLNTGNPPDDGAVFTCRCGFLGIWESHYWRTPHAAELDALIADFDVTDSLFAGMWAAMLLDTDRARMEAIVRAELQAAGYRPLLLDLESVVTAIGARLRAGGFHTHANHADSDDPEF